MIRPLTCTVAVVAVRDNPEAGEPRVDVSLNFPGGPVKVGTWPISEAPDPARPVRISIEWETTP